MHPERDLRILWVAMGIICGWSRVVHDEYFIVKVLPNRMRECQNALFWGLGPRRLNKPAKIPSYYAIQGVCAD